MRVAMAALLAVFFVIGCGGGGGGGGPAPAPEPANVAGTWTNERLGNAGQARFDNCTEDMSALNGLTAGTVFGPDEPGCTDNPVPVTQSGDAFTFARTVDTCPDGSRTTLTGGGTVRGRTLEGQLDEFVEDPNDPPNVRGTAFFTGTVSEDQVQLSVNRLEARAGIRGACDVRPPLRASYTIVR
jgi:hypothetical protein